MREVREPRAGAGYGEPDRTYQERPKQYNYRDNADDKSCCSPMLILIGGLIFLLLVILALLYGLGVIGGPIPSGNTTTAAAPTPAPATGKIKFI